MSSYLKIRQQKRNLKNKSIVSAYENDISNDEFDAYYKKCQDRRQLRVQNMDLIARDSDTNSSGDSLSPTPTPSPTHNQSLDENETISGCMDEGAQTTITTNFQGIYKHIYSMLNNFESGDFYTEEEIERAFYEAEKWADF